MIYKAPKSQKESGRWVAFRLISFRVVYLP